MANVFVEDGEKSTKYLGITVTKRNIFGRKLGGIQLLVVIRLKYVDFKLQIRATKVQLYVLFCVGVGIDQSHFVNEV